MKKSAEFQQHTKQFRDDLKREIRKLANEIAGPLPTITTNAKGCIMKPFVNVGEREFDNIGRIYVMCVTRSHTHKKIAIHTTDRLNPEAMQQFKDLRAAYELTGAQFSACTRQVSTEEEKMHVLDMLLHRPALPSPPPSSPLGPALSSTLLGKRKVAEEYTPSKSSKRARIDLPPFLMRSATPEASTSTASGREAGAPEVMSHPTMMRDLTSSLLAK
ncbi:hypothetical protein MPER_10049 [Moniliophthora perniciosa FA553]|nr:hypothetical protein MPER_10049 [Moniliophthora perniciosa FA553]